jgi:hypothetical protein
VEMIELTRQRVLMDEQLDGIEESLAVATVVLEAKHQVQRSISRPNGCYWIGQDRECINEAGRQDIE